MKYDSKIVDDELDVLNDIRNGWEIAAVLPPGDYGSSEGYKPYVYRQYVRFIMRKEINHSEIETDLELELDDELASFGC